MGGTYVRVKVHPAASQDALVTRGPDQFEVWVRAKPVDGKASEAAGRLLARHLQVPPSRLRLIRGWESRQKLFEVLGPTHRSLG